MANGNGENGNGRVPFIESAATSMFMTGLARILTIVMTLVVLPSIAAILSIAWGWAQDKNETDAQQTRILDRLEWRMSANENLDKEQEDHFKFSDRRLNRLERNSDPRIWPDDPQ